MAFERELSAPLDPRRVQQRAGSQGKALSYLTTHDVKRTANRIFGFTGWSYVVNELVCLGDEPFKNSKGREGIRVGYRATVTVTVGETARGDTGYGDAMEYNQSRITPHELASKEAVSDALKRCLSSWGDQFGLVLYGADPAPLEDAAEHVEPAAQPPAKRDHTFDPAETGEVVSAPQVKKLWTMARGFGLSDDQIRQIIIDFGGVESSRLIPRSRFEAVLAEIELTGRGASA